MSGKGVSMVGMLESATHQPLRTQCVDTGESSKFEDQGVGGSIKETGTRGPEILHSGALWLTRGAIEHARKMEDRPFSTLS